MWRVIMDKRLGKGLGALIPEKSTQDTSGDKVSTVDVSLVQPNKLQPRKFFDPDKLRELKESIREKGIIQPILVRVVEGGYELIAGERRFRAVKELGYSEVPAVVKNVNDADSLELSLIENIQREELSPIEEAKAYQELLEKFNFTQDAIAKAVGKDKTTVSNALRLLALPSIVQDHLSSGAITVGHAKAILSLPTERGRIRFAKRITNRNLSVRQAEELIRKRLDRPKRKTTDKDEHIAQIEESLQHYFGTRVKITPGKKHGRLEVFFYSNEDLERILSLMKRKG